MANIVFVDPPPRSSLHPRNVHPWDDIARQLKDRPGQWALCVSGMPSRTTASSINVGRVAAFRPIGAFEARTTAKGSGDDRTYDLYIRYVGEPTETTETNDDDNA